MVLVLIVGYTFKNKPQVEQFYLTTCGQAAFDDFCVLYALGFYLTVGIARFDV